jgi:hypothetical protein
MQNTVQSDLIYGWSRKGGGRRKTWKNECRDLDGIMVYFDGILEKKKPESGLSTNDSSLL